MLDIDQEEYNKIFIITTLDTLIAVRYQIYSLVQDCSKFNANALELPQSWISYQYQVDIMIYSKYKADSQVSVQVCQMW